MVEYSTVWHGDRVRDDILDAVVEALNEAGLEGEPFLRGLTPVRTGFLRDSTYVIVDVNGLQPVLIFGQAADYAMEVELGTRYTFGHFQITQTAMYVFPTLPDRIEAALASRGYGYGAGGGSWSAGSAGPGIPNPYTGGRLGSQLGQAIQQAPLVQQTPPSR